MIWSASSVWWQWRIACCGFGAPGWGASPGWSSGMPSRSARNCLQHNWPFRQSAAGAVLWRSLLTTPSFTANVQASWRFHGSYPDWKVLRPGSQFCVQQCGTEVEQTGTLCVSLLTQHYACRDLDNEKEGTLQWQVFFFSQTLVAFYKHQIKVKIQSERKRLSSLEFGKRWVTVARLCRMIGASLIFNFDIIGT